MADATDDALVEAVARAMYRCRHKTRQNSQSWAEYVHDASAALAVAVPAVREAAREEVLKRLENPDEAMQIAALKVQLPDSGEPPLWHKIAIALAAAIRAQGEG